MQHLVDHPAPPRGRQRRRQRWVVVTIGVLVTILLVAAGVAVSLYRDALRSNVGALLFRNSLRIPPLLEARADEQGRRGR